MLVILAGVFIYIVIAPGVLRYLFTSEVRLLPSLGIRGRFLHKCPETLNSRGITTKIDLKRGL
jgi:hypothetical protein